MNYRVKVVNIKTQEVIYEKEHPSFTVASSDKKNKIAEYRGLQYKFIIEPILKEAYTEDESK